MRLKAVCKPDVPFELNGFVGFIEFIEFVEFVEFIEFIEFVGLRSKR